MKCVLRILWLADDPVFKRNNGIGADNDSAVRRKRVCLDLGKIQNGVAWGNAVWQRFIHIGGNAVKIRRDQAQKFPPPWRRRGKKDSFFQH